MQFNLQIKLLIFVCSVVVLAMVILAFLTISKQRQFFQDSFKEKAIVLAQALDASVASQEELKDVTKLQSNIYKLIWLNPDITKINISLPTSEGLKIIASNDTRIIGSLAAIENNLSFNQGTVLTKTLLRPDGSQELIVVTPVHVGGQRVGTYDIGLSLEPERQALAQQQKQLIILIVIILLFILVTLFVLIRKTVISPILEIKEGLRIIGKGNLSWRLTPRSSDEIGDLVLGLNKMTAKLESSYGELEEKIKERTEELEEAKAVLEVKVKARTRELENLTKSLEEQVKDRTKELQEKVNELEKFHKLAVGRELKMIELKKEIKRWQKKLEKKK